MGGNYYVEERGLDRFPERLHVVHELEGMVESREYLVDGVRVERGGRGSGGVMSGDYKYGDHVAYDDGGGTQVGRFVRCAYGDGGTAFVCFHEGCTAAAVPVGGLRPATDEEAAGAGRLGHHRFDDGCPEYDEEICHVTCMERFGMGER